MSKHKYWDDDVEDAISLSSIGNADVVEIRFNKKLSVFNIHKQDVIHLAKQFGLDVHESDSRL